MTSTQPDAGGGKARGAIAGQVELPASLASAGCEEAIVRRLVGQHRIAQIGADLVRALPDAGPDRSRRRRRRRAEMCHGGDGRLDHAGDGAAPAGMGGGNHAGSRVGEQDGGAIGGDDAERDVRAVGHHGVRARTGAGRPGCRDMHHLGAVHLRQSDEAGRVGSDRARRPGAVLQHGVGRILAGEAAVEAGIGPAGDAAQAGEEPVRVLPRSAERIGSALSFTANLPRIQEGTDRKGGKPPGP